MTSQERPRYRFITVVQENQYTANEYFHSKSQIKCNTNG